MTARGVSGECNMGIEIEVKSNLLAEALVVLTNGSGRATEYAVKRIAARAKKAIQSPPKSGKVYTSTKQPSPHQASAPGEAPANWTGELAEHVKAHRVAANQCEVRIDGVPYAARLEFGGAHMAPRPFLGPAAEAERDAYRAKLAEELAKLK